MVTSFFPYSFCVAESLYSVVDNLYTLDFAGIDIPGTLLFRTLIGKVS